MPKNRWYVITGGPSAGKSTLLAELEKMGHKTFPEAARVLIDEAVASGKSLSDIRANENEFQLAVLKRKLQLEAEQPGDRLIFLDRGMQDTLAYLRLHDLPIGKEVSQAMKGARYKRVFLLEPLDRYDTDYARTESREEALELNRLLREAYREYGMDPISVPVLPPKKRARFVLGRIKEKEGQPA